MKPSHSNLVVDDATKGGQRGKPWPSYPKHAASTAAVITGVLLDVTHEYPPILRRLSTAIFFKCWVGSWITQHFSRGFLFLPGITRFASWIFCRLVSGHWNWERLIPVSVRAGRPCSCELNISLGFSGSTNTETPKFPVNYLNPTD